MDLTTRKRRSQTFNEPRIDREEGFGFRSTPQYPYLATTLGKRHKQTACSKIDVRELVTVIQSCDSFLGRGRNWQKVGPSVHFLCSLKSIQTLEQFRLNNSAKINI